MYVAKGNDIVLIRSQNQDAWREHGLGLGLSTMKTYFLVNSGFSFWDRRHLTFG